MSLSPPPRARSRSSPGSGHHRLPKKHCQEYYQEA